MSSLFVPDAAMLTERFDSAFDAMTRCRAQVLFLLDCYGRGGEERVAIERLLGALDAVSESFARASRAGTPPRGREAHDLP
ncbi:hypothetical protein [Phenylobacterium montanum]|uniref:Uncharacterized protein n=1 Tax=Phenylobacterium montanum TaxID=2823693 RepID=A0A975ITM1_9CAUL|nr:hypothetical protein [Caulobacter sp. S6]QUD86880.1 hypothetical protein KCG34_17625 [Caulobacter sp. S6]